MERSVAIIQARMASTRLPGKVLMSLGGRPVLGWVLSRLANARLLDEIVVATSEAAEDEAIAEFCSREGVACFRGSENDVLGRFVGAAEAYRAGWIVRVNSDNPLIDPAYVDALLEHAKQGEADYVSFRRDDGRPVMLTSLSFFVEVLSRSCLLRAARTITDPFEREHVTLGIYMRPQEFKLWFLPVPDCCNDERLRFTLDTPADLDMLKEVFAALGRRVREASAEEVVRLVSENPQWLRKMAELNSSNPKTAKEVD